jgi:hypothetical protein
MDGAAADYLAANTPISPAIQGRINCTDSNLAAEPSCPVITSP